MDVQLMETRNANAWIPLKDAQISLISTFLEHLDLLNDLTEKKRERIEVIESRKLKKCAFSVARYFSDQNSLRTEASRV